MLWIMIKNNLKLMLRSKWILGIIIIGPIITIAELSSAFGELMKMTTDVGRIRVGYEVEENSPYKDYMNDLITVASKNEMDFISCSQSESEKLMKDNEIQVFVSFGNKDVTLYQNEKNEMQANKTKYMIYHFLHNGEKTLEIPTKQTDFLKLPTAINYYGKIEIVYFIWCSMVVLAVVISSERKNRIQQRLKISTATNLQLYLSKVIPSFLANLILMGISTVISSFIFDIQWGCYAKTIGLFIVACAAVSSFSVVLFYLVSSPVIGIVIEFVLVWFLGFMGGSFEIFYFSSVPDLMKRLSPIYYLNRAFVEYETRGESDYGMLALWYYTGIFVVCLVVGSMIMKRRLEEH